VSNILERAKSYGHVIIITNAQTGWVEISCQKFMPKVYPMLSSIRILSARSQFENLHPSDPTSWKIAAFSQELQRFYADKHPETCKNVVSIGDSSYERFALHHVSNAIGPSMKAKSVKFVEKPTVEQLTSQLELVSACFDQIATYNSSLDLLLTVTLS
jgi:hypothetical protein